MVLRLFAKEQIFSARPGGEAFEGVRSVGIVGKNYRPLGKLVSECVKFAGFIIGIMVAVADDKIDWTFKPLKIGNRIPNQDLSEAAVGFGKKKTVCSDSPGINLSTTSTLPDLNETSIWTL